MKTNKLLVFGASLGLSLFCLVILKTSPAFAATRTWDGGGGVDNNFNTAANWAGDVVPSNGDDLVFSLTGMTEDRTANNNISNLSVNSITFSGSNTNSSNYLVGGNAITVTNAITDAGSNNLNFDITLGGNVTATMQDPTGGTTFGTDYSGVSIHTNGNTLTITGSGASCGMQMYSKLAGSGGVSINLPNGGVRFMSDASNFSGSVAISGGTLGVESTGVFGSTSGVTVSGTGVIVLALAQADRTYSFPLTVGGTGKYGSSIYASKGGTSIGCHGGGSDSTYYKATLAGSLTLTSDVVYNAFYINTNVTGTFTSNGHDLTVKSGSQGSITTSAGTVSPPVEVITVNAGDDQPGTNISIGQNQTYIVNGVRGGVSVDFGGTLKGSGVLIGIYVHDGGRLSPGQSPGCLTSNDDVTLEGGSHFDVELGGTTACSGYDQLIVNGDVYLSDAIINVSVYGSFTPAAGQTYLVINNDGSDAINGTFDDLPEGATFNSGGYVYRISYVGGDGNDVVLTVVSVPAAPDTGFAYFQNRPLATLLATSLVASVVIVLARIYNKRMNAKV